MLLNGHFINKKSEIKYYTIIPLDNRGFCYERKKL